MTSTAQTPTSWVKVEADLERQLDISVATLRVVPSVEQALEKYRFSFALPQTLSTSKSTTLSPQEQQLYTLQRKNTLSALKECAQLTRELSHCKSTIKEINKLARTCLISNEKRYCQEMVSKLREHISKLVGGINELASKNPEAFNVVHSRPFRAYARQLAHGKIAITPFVADKIDEIRSTLENTRMAVLHGPTGSGKSEVAELVALRAMIPS